MPRVGTGLVAGLAVALASCSGGSQSATPVPRVRPQSLASSTTTVTTTTVAPIASPDQLVAPTDASSTAAEARSGIPWVYLAAVHFIESRMGRIHGNSPAGAQGPMQFLANTWATFGNGGDIDDDHDDRGNAAATRGLAQTLMLSLW